jgi:hypothetical protein
MLAWCIHTAAGAATSAIRKIANAKTDFMIHPFDCSGITDAALAEKKGAVIVERTRATLARKKTPARTAG